MLLPLAGLAVTYIRSTGEHAPATIISRSTRGEDFIHLKDMRSGHEIENHAPFDHVLFLILCQKIGSLNAFQSLLPSLLQSLPQRESMCKCSR